MRQIPKEKMYRRKAWLSIALLLEALPTRSTRPLSGWPCDNRVDLSWPHLEYVWKNRVSKLNLLHYKWEVVDCLEQSLALIQLTAFLLPNLNFESRDKTYQQGKEKNLISKRHNRRINKLVSSPQFSEDATCLCSPGLLPSLRITVIFSSGDKEASQVLEVERLRGRSETSQ